MPEKLYLIEIDYIGPNRASKGLRAHMVRVLRKPGRKNLSGERCVEGWLGTTDNWHKQALGEFTLESARKHLLAEFGVTNAGMLPLAFGDEIYIP